MTIAIIGAGMAGLACAEALTATGRAVVLFDKGRGPGGRMSTRRMETPLGTVAFDHGAQYFTARDAGFARRVAAWQAQGVVAPWPVAGTDAFVGTPAMNAPIRAMAERLEVRWAHRIERMIHTSEGWQLIGEGVDAAGFEAVVVAVPAEQVADLIGAHDPAIAARARVTVSAPCWTVMAAFDRRVPITTDALRDTGPIGWAARNSAKPGRTGPEAWVVQGGPDWSRDHLEAAADSVIDGLMTALADAAKAPMPSPVAVTAHRWRYAKSGNDGGGACWNAGLALGVCGDWLAGPRVEAAWMSGTALARSMA